jgi:hypothetical protein
MISPDKESQQIPDELSEESSDPVENVAPLEDDVDLVEEEQIEEQTSRT